MQPRIDDSSRKAFSQKMRTDDSSRKAFSQKMPVSYSGSGYSDGYSGSGYPGGYSDGYSGSGYSADSYSGSGFSDHVCRPVIVDAEGRKQPIIFYNPDPNTESYVTKTETIVEHVRAPLITDYKYGSPAKVEVFKDYGANNDKWRRPSSPVHDRPQNVEEFITTVQTEASRPTRPGLLGPTHWRNTGTNTGYGEHGNYGNSTAWNKPTGNTIRDESYDDYYRRNDNFTEPTTRINKDSWDRPSQPLTKPTNDIGAAVALLKEAVKSSSITAAPPQPRYTAPLSTVPRQDAYAETIDSREAAKRYGKFNFASRPVRTGETYTGTIDSREAMMKYNGSVVPR